MARFFSPYFIYTYRQACREKRRKNEESKKRVSFVISVSFLGLLSVLQVTKNDKKMTYEFKFVSFLYKFVILMYKWCL